MTVQPMAVLVVIISVFALLVLGGGVALWFVFRQKQAPRTAAPAAKETTAATAPAFRWSYIIMPLAILLLTVISAAYFYRLLPPQVGYHFQADGSADRWLGRGTLLLAMLLPQFLLALLAGGIAFGVTRLGVIFRSGQPISSKVGGIISLMSNMVALPQIILGFAMLDIFSYNAYQIHLLPLWAFALLVMLVGGIALGIFFIRAMQQLRAVSQ
jgi:uncharacterized membrane protein